MLILIVHYTVRPGTEDQAKEFGRKMEEFTRKEPGCRMYVCQQSIENARHFCFYEQYDDQAALDAHRAAAYFAEYVTNGIAKIGESRQAEKFEPVGNL
jgi:quinol monooxygenase YgiN